MANGEQITSLVPWVYDLWLWIMSVLVDLFFREVHPRGSWRVPRTGPVMFVAAPHANQFIDPLILMRVLRLEAKRRVSNLIAAKSMHRRFIGTMAHMVGSIPVGRALDGAKSGQGTVYLPDPSGDPLLIRGHGTNFEKQAYKGGLVVLPYVNGGAANAEVLDIIGPEELRLKKEFKGEDALRQLTGQEDVEHLDSLKVAPGFQGTKYKTAPKVDQTKVYEAVFDRLQHDGCICIFPEGGSHDRTELLPLKPGVAIMALGSLAAHPDSGLKIVCCGMNYFHAHKFRSRAVVEFGLPIDVPPELVEMYRSGEKREATRQLLEIIYNGLLAVTVTAPDYDTLMLIQATRRLYKPKGKKLPLPMIMELNRRLTKGYNHYKDDPRIVALKKSVMDYNKQLWLLGVRDHQVEYARFTAVQVIATLIYRVLKLGVLALGTLPGFILFAPIFVAAKVISIRKSREALAASTVKLQGRDVVATWKLLVALALAPLLYTFYTVLLTYWTYRNRVQGYVPTWVPLWLIVMLGYIVFPAITFAALRIGEIGMDILKSLPPLLLSLNPSSANTLVKLRTRREQLSAQVTELINTLGPEMFEDFDHWRLVADPFKDGLISDPNAPTTPPPARRTRSTRSAAAAANNALTDSPTASTPPPGRVTTRTGSIAHESLPRNESFGNLGSIGFFSTRPPSRSRSRSNSMSASGFAQEGGNGNNGTGVSSGLHGASAAEGLRFTTTKAHLDEVSRKIRGAMQERGKERTRRRSVGTEGSWEFAGADAEPDGSNGASATATPEEGKKGR